MTSSLKTRVLVRGSSTWRITRFSDELFVAKNAYGRQHTFRCEAEVNRFWDYLETQGYALRAPGRFNETLVRQSATADA